MFLKSSYKRDKIIEAMLIYTDCTSDKEAQKGLEYMYSQGMDLEDCYRYFVINAPVHVELNDIY